MRVMSDELSPIPTHIRVGPYRYTVYRDSARMADIRNESDVAHRVGQVSFQKLEIDIDPKLAHDRQVSTILHEVLHACWQFANLDNFTDEKVDSEQIISGLERGVLCVLRDNPDLVAYLTDCRDVT